MVHWTKIRSILIVITLGAASTFAGLSGQTNVIDSLLLQLNKVKDDSIQIELHFKLAAAYREDEKPDLATKTCDLALWLAKKPGNSQSLPAALRKITHHFRQISQPDSMAYYAAKAARLYTMKEDWTGSASAHLDWGQAMQIKGDHLGANALFIKAGELNIQGNADSLNDRIYINIASTFSNLVDTTLELEYLRQAKRIADRYQHVRNQIIARLGLSGSMVKLQEFDSAQIQLQEAIVLTEKLEDPVLKGYIFINSANLAMNGGLIDEATDNFKKATETKGVPPFDQLRFRLFYAKHLLKIRAYNSSEKEAKTLLREAIKIGAMDLQLDAHDLLMDISENLQKYKQGLYHAKKFALLNDSLFNEGAQSEIRNLSLQFESAQKEKEIQTLRAQKAEKEIELITSKSRARNRLLLAILCLASLIGAAISFSFYKKENDAKRELLDQTNKIDKLQIQQLQNEQESLALKSMIKGEEEERQRIARDLHDGLGGLLSTLKISLGYVLPGLQDKIKDKVYQSLQIADKATVELRQIAHNLIPESLSRFGLITAIEDLTADITFHTDLEVEFQNINLVEDSIRTDKVQLYRIIQELLNNVIKHARAQTVFVQMLQRDDKLICIVEDNGVGLKDKITSRQGMGMKNIDTRLKYLKGLINIDSDSDLGVTITISIPLAHD